MTFGPTGVRDEESGYIIDAQSAERTNRGVILLKGDERAIVATSTFQLICLGLSRTSGWFMYPTLLFVFVSKFRGTTTLLNKTALAIRMYGDTHELHVYCGWTIFICSVVHSFSHFARWEAQDNLHLLHSNISGITGVLIFLFCLLICAPMTVFRTRIKYEIRKNVHYLFILFALGLMFHTPPSAIPNGGFSLYVFGTLLIWFFVDSGYCYLFMTEKITSPKFSVLPTGVRMTMSVSKKFQKVKQRGGFCYVCVPWVKKTQWHAFSLFENPSNPAERQIFVQRAGDWTTELHNYLQNETVPPVWISGPFPSPYDNAEVYENQILVVSGIGITPALSVIEGHRQTRKINLIWVVRDPHLLTFILCQMYLEHNGWNVIFYTGNESLDLSSVDTLSGTNICIVRGRPNLDTVIPNIIFGVESRQGVPSDYAPIGRKSASEILLDRVLFSTPLESQNDDEFEVELEFYAMELGFPLSTEHISNMLQRHRQNREMILQDEVERRRASNEMLGYLSFGFRPWIDMEFAADYVRKLDPKKVLSTWGLLYCGGAKPLLEELEHISEEYQIELHVESFEW